MKRKFKFIALIVIFFTLMYPLSAMIHYVMKFTIHEVVNAILPILYSVIFLASLIAFYRVNQTNASIAIRALIAALLLFFIPTLKSETSCHPSQVESLNGWIMSDPQLAVDPHPQLLYVSSLGLSIVELFVERECSDADNVFIRTASLAKNYQRSSFFIQVAKSKFRLFHLLSIVGSLIILTSIILIAKRYKSV